MALSFGSVVLLSYICRTLTNTTMNNQYNFNTKEVHISTIKWGDTVDYDGHMRTVGKKDIIHGGFMGSSLFGDSHKLGRILVKKIIFKTS